MRFALNGFDKEKQKSNKIAMAIRLGAKVSWLFLYIEITVVF